MLDVQGRKVFRTSPINVAVIRDFNRIDVEGLSPDALEQAWSPFEDQIVGAIRRVISTRKLPVGEDLDLIINLMCLLATRNPRFRDMYNRMRIQGAEEIMEKVVSDRELYDKEISTSGDAKSRQISFENMKRFVEGKNYRLEIPTSLNISVEYELFNNGLPILGRRFWSIFIAPENSRGFLCCDHPVALVFKDMMRNRGVLIGFDLPETEVYFPISSRICFYGTFEDPLCPEVKLRKLDVEKINLSVISYARRYVYSARKITEGILDQRWFSFHEISPNVSL